MDYGVSYAPGPACNGARLEFQWGFMCAKKRKGKKERKEGKDRKGKERKVREGRERKLKERSERKETQGMSEMQIHDIAGKERTGKERKGRNGKQREWEDNGKRRNAGKGHKIGKGRQGRTGNEMKGWERPLPGPRSICTDFQPGRPIRRQFREVF